MRLFDSNWVSPIDHTEPWQQSFGGDDQAEDGSDENPEEQRAERGFGDASVSVALRIVNDKIKRGELGEEEILSLEKVLADWDAHQVVDECS
tara:strand:+ start:2889 stop:3164 length:276 start_codon:yes stop_codon:yes gene_type:complete